MTGKDTTPPSVPLVKTDKQNGYYAEFTLSDLDEFEINATDHLNVSCDLFAHAMQKGRQYTLISEEPEVHNFTVQFKLHDSNLMGTPHEEFTKKIQEAKDTLIFKWKWVSSLGKTLRELESYCGYGRQLVAAWGAFGLVESIGLTIKAIGLESIGEPIFIAGCWSYESLGAYVIDPVWLGNSPGDGGFKTERCAGKFAAGQTGEAGRTAVDGAQTLSNVQYVNDPFKNADFWPGMRWMCDYLSCKLAGSWTDSVLSATGGTLFDDAAESLQIGQTQINGGGEFSGESMGQGAMNVLADYTDSVTSGLSSKSIMNNIDARNSLPWSVINLCLPGVVWNLEKYRQIQCRYIRCLEDTAKGEGQYNVGNIALCEMEKGSAQCMEVTGEFTNFFGITMIMSNVAERINQLALNLLPTALRSVFENMLCKQLESSDGVAADDTASQIAYNVACVAPKYYYGFVDALQKWEDMKNTPGQYGSMLNYAGFNEQNICDGID